MKLVDLIRDLEDTLHRELTNYEYRLVRYSYINGIASGMVRAVEFNVTESEVEDDNAER